MPLPPLSPAIRVTQYSQVTTIPAVSTTIGAFVGNFQWGPVDQITQVPDEPTLVRWFQKPDQNTYVSFLSAASFLAYGNNLALARSVGTTALNSTTNGAGLLIKNNQVWANAYASGTGGVGEWAGRYPGGLGNSLFVSLCPNSNAFSQNISATGPAAYANTTASSAQITFNANAALYVTAGDLLSIGGSSKYAVINISANGLNATLNTAFPSTLTLNVVSRNWAYSGFFVGAPNTSTYVANQAGSRDQYHVIVIDQAGLHSTQTSGANTVLEVWPYLSKATDARNIDGSTNYGRDVIYNRSGFIYWMANYNQGVNWGNTASGTKFNEISSLNQYTTLAGGVTANPLDGDLELTWALFEDKDGVDIDLVFTGGASNTVASFVIQNIAAARQDCMAFVSPQQTDVVQTPGNELTNITATAALLPYTSYAVVDNNWKLMLDKYNNVNRWVPVNPDIAGLCVLADTNAYPWYSPADPDWSGIKNCIQLAWNAKQPQRDSLAQIGVVSVINKKGQGNILYGDITFLTQPSPFGQIGVQRLFITLEKIIAAAAAGSMFKFNDEFSQAAFINLVDPLLRDIKGQQGVADKKVICDGTNNTQTVLLQKGFVGDIYIQPNYTTNWIQLNFTAVGPSVTFTTTVTSA